MKRAVAIAGSDSSGGAGIQADLRAFIDNEVRGSTVITALTAQNSVEVKQISVVPIEMIVAQIDAVFEEGVPGAVKVGMLYDALVVEAVCERLAYWKPSFIVVDPVMVASSGACLLEPSAIVAVRTQLFPLATLITPNLIEVEHLLSESCDDFVQAGRRLLQWGPGAVLVKGGHHKTRKGWDCLVAAGSPPYWLKQETVSTENVHGTGCRLSSAITAFLAKGHALRDAVFHGKSYVHRYIQG
ncbi:MAG: Hydroxymethylpyrimidine/phosphomethylpyrimidine kinase [Chlamydiales bacterium]|nr:Hydroxymethylpyrimidine/phosphomethylpyrimidine kinase [Chlamydiales bacterium]